MNRAWLPLLLLLASFSALAQTPSPCPSVGAQSWKNRFWSDAEFKFSARYRADYIDEDELEDARAGTLRPRFSYQSGSWRGIRVGTELDAAMVVGWDRYDDGTDENSPYAQSPNAEYIEFNQAWLGWRNDRAELRYGRQAFALDNERFVGGNSFWQNEQTYDGLGAWWRGAEWAAFYAYVYNVNRNSPPSTAGANLDSNTHMLNARYQVAPWMQAVAYFYRMDLGAELSNDTWGARLSGQYGDDLHLHYEAEYAKQDEGQGATPYNADYWLVSLGGGLHSADLTVGVEHLGGDLTGEFQTPLASLHEFNGWTDRFTRGNMGWGLQDIFVRLRTPLPADVRFEIHYHAYSMAVSHPEWGHLDFGDEHGLVFQRSWGRHWRADFTYMRFRPEDGSFGYDEARRNVKKYWLTIEYTF